MDLLIVQPFFEKFECSISRSGGPLGFCGADAFASLVARHGAAKGPRRPAGGGGCAHGCTPAKQTSVANCQTDRHEWSRLVTNSILRNAWSQHLLRSNFSLNPMMLPHSRLPVLLHVPFLFFLRCEDADCSSFLFNPTCKIFAYDTANKLEKYCVLYRKIEKISTPLSKAKQSFKDDQ